MVLNPVRAKSTRKPDSYRWSSYRATAGRAAVPRFLAVDSLLAHFGKQRAAAQRKYERFVAEGMGQASPWQQLQGQVLLGSEAFVERLRPALEDKRSLREIARRQRVPTRPALTTLFGSSVSRDINRRNAAIRRAHLEHGYSLSAIGQAVGLHYSTISRIANRDRDTEDTRNKV